MRKISQPEFIPTRSFQFMHVLGSYFPQHRLIMTDFDMLPDAIPGKNSPVVQTRFENNTIACDTYLVMPGMFDIFFPTDFGLFRDFYQIVLRSNAHASFQQRKPKILTHRHFMETYGELEQTRLRNGDNPLLLYYENCKFFLS